MWPLNKHKEAAMRFKNTLVITAITSSLLACSTTQPSSPANSDVQAVNIAVPADKFDLSQWKITLPLDDNNDGKIDEVSEQDIQAYSHPNFFYLDDNGHMVFATPNKATTTANSSNTRSEMRHMLRGDNKRIKTSAFGNNFAISAHTLSKHFARVGGKMEASLKVDHVAVNAKNPNKPPAFSVVVGQIHAGKDKHLLKKTKNQFGWGNEPIKIYYKKWPNHDTGSVFWNYERNLAKKDPNRTDISYPVWGNGWTDSADPGEAGVALGDEFSYVINVHGDIMYLEFSAPGKDTIKFSINLANNIDANGDIDSLDNPFGYALDWNYFKAGAYNQCSTKSAKGLWYAGCAGTGDWETDKANGDYTQVTFSKLIVGESTAP